MSVQRLSLLRSLTAHLLCTILLLQTGPAAYAVGPADPPPEGDGKSPAVLEQVETWGEAAVQALRQWRGTSLAAFHHLASQVLTAKAAAQEPPPKQTKRTPPQIPAGPDRSTAAAPSEAAPGRAAAPGDLPIFPGLNLLSLPKEPTDPNPAAVLAAIEGQYESVHVFNACDTENQWKIYDPLALPSANDLTAMDHRFGFWLKGLTATAMPVTGTQAPITQVSLCVGWNLIGYPLPDPRPVPSALASIEGKYLRVFGYEVADEKDPWEIYDVAVPAWANDMEVLQPGRGYWVLVTEATTLTFANEGPAPVVEILTPADTGEVTAPTQVVGTVASDLLQSWRLEYRSAEDRGDWTEIATGTTPVNGAELGEFDPTLLLNGLYELRLTATDFAGQSTKGITTVVVDGGMKIGNFTLSFVDLRIPLSGLDLEVIRTYDSRDRVKRDFGIGWTLDIRQGSYRNNRIPGEGWQILSGSLPCQQVVETKSHLTTVRLSDVEVYRFQLGLTSPATVAGGCFARAGFAFVDGPVPGATLEILGNTEVIYQNAGNQVVDRNTLEPYEPEQVRLTTRDGRIFDLDLTAGVTRLEDLNGNQIQITDAGITHSVGRVLPFERDAEGRITAITDPRGERLSYSFDAAGDLVTVTDQLEQSTRFTYQDHYLTEIEDARGVTPVRNEYDPDRRLLRHIDAFGKVLAYEHDLDNRREVVTDRLGRSRLMEYDGRGNVLREVNAEGEETLRTFDGRDNLLTERDPLGNTTAFMYDANDDLLKITDALGNEGRFTYNSRGQMLTSTDARGGVNTSQYDAAGNLTLERDALGNETRFEYDSRGNLTLQTDPLGNGTRFEYDTAGNLIRQIDALGTAVTSTFDDSGNLLTETTTRTTPAGPETLVTSFVYDAVGRQIERRDPDGTRERTEYDALGNVTQAIDKLSRATTNTYDPLGRLTKVTFPDSTTEERTYDPEGRLLALKDRGGRTTNFVYDGVGRLLETQFPDASTTRTGYDAAGRIATQTDGRGNTTAFAYDAAGRRTEVTDALGRKTKFTYDANGNQVAFLDARNAETRTVYDAENRPIRTLFPDGTEATTTYDALGRRTAETDPAGNTTAFAYDALGRLTQVTDALGQVTSFTYDEVGNRLTQIDANGHTTNFEYDALGRQTARTLPAEPAPSGAAATERHEYDAVGNRIARTDFAGRRTTFQYDVNNRLLARNFPDGTGHSFTYSATGQRLTATDARGVTRYGYDSRDRLTSVEYPDGRRVTYGHDAAGNRTTLNAVLGAVTLTTTHTHDPLNRLDTVTDPGGHQYRHTYDPVGNRASLTHPNGVATEYRYDSRNRLTFLESKTAGEEVVQSYAYTLGPAGNRTRIEEHDSTVRSYDYDALYRLTGETVTQAAVTVYQNLFAYDPVGNRLHQTHQAGTEPAEIVPYSYDRRDRLLTEGAITYSWDANGNLVGKNGAEGATYTWDFQDRLTQVTTADGTVTKYAYDADGNRVRTEITPPNGPPEVVNHLVDPSGELSHVVAESDAAGNLIAYYSRGDDLLAVLRPDAVRFYHADALGSIRVLTDDTAQGTDRYTFGAFGTLLDHTGDDPNAYLFAGEPLDVNSGFYYLRARWMDPGVGRFAGMDPFGGSIFEQMSLHRYLYAHVDPVNQVDPTGLFVGGVAEVQIVTAVRSILISIQADVGFLLVEGTQSGGQVDVTGIVIGAGILGAAGLAVKYFARTLGRLRASFLRNTRKTDLVGGGTSLENLSLGQRQVLQKFATDNDVSVTVVGSRAARPGGNGPDSDFDFIIEPFNSKLRKKAKRQLPRGQGGGEFGPRGPTGRDFLEGPVRTDEPFITFIPEGR